MGRYRACGRQMGWSADDQVSCVGADKTEGALLGGAWGRSHGEADSRQPKERGLLWLSPKKLKS